MFLQEYLTVISVLRECLTVIIISVDTQGDTKARDVIGETDVNNNNTDMGITQLLLLNDIFYSIFYFEC